MPVLHLRFAPSYSVCRNVLKSLSKCSADPIVAWADSERVSWFSDHSV